MSGYCPDCGNTLCVCDEMDDLDDLDRFIAETPGLAADVAAIEAQREIAPEEGGGVSAVEPIVDCPHCTAMSICEPWCARESVCKTCHRPKQRIGRSMPMDAHGSYCPMDCPGYRENPYPPHLWPNEWADHLAGHPEVS